MELFAINGAVRVIGGEGVGGCGKALFRARAIAVCTPDKLRR